MIMFKCHTKKSFYTWRNKLYHLFFYQISYFYLNRGKWFSRERFKRGSLTVFYILFQNIFTLFPFTSCLSQQLTLCTWCSKPTLTFFALLLKPIKFTAKESSDYKAAQSSHPSFPSSVCIHVCSCVCMAPRAMLRADQVGMWHTFCMCVCLSVC